MTVTLNLPPQVEQAYLAEAQARGLELADLVREVLVAAKPVAVSGGGLMAARAHCRRTLARTNIDLNTLVIGTEAGLLVNKSRKVETGEGENYQNKRHHRATPRP